MKRKGLNILSAFMIAGIASGCAGPSGTAEPGKSAEKDLYPIPRSYLAVEPGIEDLGVGSQGDADQLVAKEAKNKLGKAKYLQSLEESLGWTVNRIELASGPAGELSDSDEIRVAAEKMPLRDFVHYVFGQLLGVNYVLDASIEAAGDAPADRVTLSIPEAMSSKQLFTLASAVLEGRGVKLKFSNQTFFVFREDVNNPSSQFTIGIGRDKSSVPKTTGRIMQVIPIKFGIKVTMERTLIGLGGARITPDFSQSTIFAEGSREQILKVIELIDLLDTPSTRGRYIGLVELSYMPAEVFAEKVVVLLENEGINASVGKPNNKNVVLVPLVQMGAIAMFATDRFFIERVRYWSKLLDVPAEGEGKKFYIYNPKYSRAEDLEESITSLLGIASDTDPGSGNATGNAPSASRRAGPGFDGINIGMDEKANALIFYTTGQKYRGMLPLLKELDVMPKQVMLDILIAEVSLKDEFKHGVEWAVARGEVNLTTQGAFGATSIGGLGLVLNGTEGTLQANSLATNSLVNVLSNPSLMVRAGTSANINVGSSISIVGATTQDPINGDRQTSSVEYKKTGVNISVDVNVNAVGIVAMEIQQNISNSVPGGSGAGGNPDIFERSLSTEVLARSGQTVLLGGLISQTSNNGGSGVPLLSKVPLLGNLFKTKAKASDRTELVMLVTPRVIEDLAGWDDVLQDFSRALQYLQPVGK